MPKEYSCYDDLVDVAGLKSHDDVLFIGGNASFPYVKKSVRSISYVKKVGELEKLVASEKTFDRIFIARENVLDERLVTAAVQLSRRSTRPQDTAGLVCFFSDDSTLRAGFVELVEKNYPTADIWSSNSNVGPVVMTNAKGNPGWMD